jgi:hypothetical protein
MLEIFRIFGSGCAMVNEDGEQTVSGLIFNLLLPSDGQP